MRGAQEENGDPREVFHMFLCLRHSEALFGYDDPTVFALCYSMSSNFHCCLLFAKAQLGDGLGVSQPSEDLGEFPGDQRIPNGQPTSHPPCVPPT